MMKDEHSEDDELAIIQLIQKYVEGEDEALKSGEKLKSVGEKLLKQSGKSGGKSHSKHGHSRGRNHLRDRRSTEKIRSAQIEGNLTFMNSTLKYSLGNRYNLFDTPSQFVVCSSLSLAHCLLFFLVLAVFQCNKVGSWS